MRSGGKGSEGVASRGVDPVGKAPPESLESIFRPPSVFLLLNFLLKEFGLVSWEFFCLFEEGRGSGVLHPCSFSGVVPYSMLTNDAAFPPFALSRWPADGCHEAPP